jgi:ribonuclease P protein component
MNSLLLRGYFFILVIAVFLINKNITIRRKHTFGRDEKLKSRKLIQLLFKEGKSFSNFPLRIIYAQPEKNYSHLQATFSVSSKNFKKAVERNRIKRLMREAYRLQKTLLLNKLEDDKKYLTVFIIYSNNTQPDFDTIFKKMGEALEQLLKIISRNS